MYFRLWLVEKSELYLYYDEEYLKMVFKIIELLYLDDFIEVGKILRL